LIKKFKVEEVFERFARIVFSQNSLITNAQMMGGSSKPVVQLRFRVFNCFLRIPFLPSARIPENPGTGGPETGNRGVEG
jgi:hypothetical protein